MQIQFTGRNIEVTPALKTHAEEKLQRLQRRDDHILSIHVILLVEKSDHIAEANVHVDGIELHAKADANDMYVAIDRLVDKLSTQITKLKEKNSDHR